VFIWIKTLIQFAAPPSPDTTTHPEGVVVWSYLVAEMYSLGAAALPHFAQTSMPERI